MFGISFSELLLVGLVALLYSGRNACPVPRARQACGSGRLKRSFNAIKQEVEREIGADEIRRQLHNEHILSLEQEARNILTPVQEQAKPVTPVAEHSIAPTPVVEAAPATPTAPTEPAPTPTAAARSP